MNTIGILLFDGVEELDAVGPWEVFGAAAKVQPDIRPITIAPTMDVVTCAKGLRLHPDHAIDDDDFYGEAVNVTARLRGCRIPKCREP